MDMLQIRFAVGDDWASYTPFEVTGTEEMSTLFRFEVGALIASGRPPEPQLVSKQATLVISQGRALTRTVRGIIEGFSVATPARESDTPICRFRIVPDLARLTLNRQSRVLCTTEPADPPAVVRSLLDGTLGGPSIRFVPAMTGRYRLLDHLAQFNETDFAFLSRLAERYGISFFFQDDGETVVFADEEHAYPAIAAPDVLTWQGWTPSSPDITSDTIGQLDAAYAAVPEQVTLHDYDDRFPVRTSASHLEAGNLSVSERVAGGEHGTWTGFGAVPAAADVQAGGQAVSLDDDLALGQAVAQAEAGTLDDGRLRLEGRSTVLRLAAGHIFTLGRHPFGDWNRRYLILSVRHTARVQRPGMPLPDGVPDGGYLNTFTVVPLDRAAGGGPAAFRPARRTPVPRMPGVMSAIVESSAQDPGQPDIDKQGRYLIRLRYDGAGTAYGEASCRVRMMSPFGGAPASGLGDGLTFPLYPGTEVAVAHINGDPDRPLIVGVVPNPLQPSLVTSQGPMHNRLTFRNGMGLVAGPPDNDTGNGTSTGNGTGTTDATAAGNTLRLWARQIPGSAGMSPTPPAPSPFQWLRLGKLGDLVTGETGVTQTEGANSGDGFDLATGGSGRIFAGQDLYLIRDGAWTDPAGSTTEPADTNRLVAIAAPRIDAVHDKAIALTVATAGAAAAAASIILDADVSGSGTASPGIQLACPDGTITVGAGTPPETVAVHAAGTLTFTAKNFKNNAVATALYTTGDKTSAVGGNVTAITLGTNTGIIVGMMSTIRVGGSLTANIALTSTINLGPVMNVNIGPNVTIATASVKVADTTTTVLGTDMSVKATGASLANTYVRLHNAAVAVEQAFADIGGPACHARPMNLYV